MARGWESKSVEEQVAEHAAKKTQGRKAALTPEEIQAERERQSLLLARANVENSLQRATNPRHREQLQLSLAHLDEKLAAFESEPEM